MNRKPKQNGLKKAEKRKWKSSDEHKNSKGLIRFESLRKVITATLSQDTSADLGFPLADVQWVCFLPSRETGWGAKWKVCIWTEGRRNVSSGVIFTCFVFVAWNTKHWGFKAHLSTSPPMLYLLHTEKRRLGTPDYPRKGNQRPPQPRMPSVSLTQADFPSNSGVTAFEEIPAAFDK